MQHNHIINACPGIAATNASGDDKLAMCPAALQSRSYVQRHAPSVHQSLIHLDLSLAVFGCLCINKDYSSSIGL